MRSSCRCRWAEHPPELAGRDVEGKVATQDALLNRQAEGRAGQRQRALPDQHEHDGHAQQRSEHAHGSCCGAQSRRAAVSAAVRKVPPSSTDSGSSARCRVTPSS